MNRIAACFLVSMCLALSACMETTLLPPDAILPDGGVYRGDIVDGFFEGQGRLDYDNGEKYVGSFKKGLMHGHGRHVFADGSIYEGEFHNGNLQGRGELKTVDEIIYTGDFLKGMLTGNGEIISSAENIKYKGEVKNWRYHGKGMIATEDSTYSGDFKTGLYHGKGTLTYYDSGSYTGEFESGTFNGQGVYKSGNAIYEGRYKDGSLTGQGTYSKIDGETYIGQFDNWVYKGEGQLTDEDGNQYIGTFQYGELDGAGSYIGVDGSHYRGDFKNGRYHGEGKLILADSSEYTGRFQYGKYHGDGVLKSKASSGETVSAEGEWHKGNFVYDDVNNKYFAPQAELALEYHQALLEKEIEAVVKTKKNKINAYFLGVGGDGTQSVFRRELEFVEDHFRNQLDTGGRSINLINHHDSATIHPLATVSSIRLALKGIAAKMDRESDILFIYISSHGSKKHSLSINHDTIQLQNVDASHLADMLNEVGIRWKVLIVSACYSGGFIPVFADDSTLIMTASDATSTSFGCSDDSEMTYFGKALFKEVLSDRPGLAFSDAFEEAKRLIKKWEDDDNSRSSNPQIHKPELILNHLKQWKNAKNKGAVEKLE